MHMNHCLRVWVVFLGFHVTISLELTNDVTLEGDNDDVRAEDVRFQVLGRAVVPGVRTHDWISSARVLLDGDKHVGFLRSINKRARDRITMIGGITAVCLVGVILWDHYITSLFLAWVLQV